MKITIPASTSQQLFYSALPNIVEFIIQEDASLRVIIDQPLAPLTDVQYTFVCERNARLQLSGIFIAQTKASVALTALLVGEYAQASLENSYLVQADEILSIITCQLHQAPKTTSNVCMKGILADKAQAHYKGTIRVEEQAVQTEACQENKTILLSAHAQAISIPCLEILTDEVQCSHGSATGQFNAEHIFYMQTRGLNSKEALTVMAEGFLLAGLPEETCALAHATLTNLIDNCR